MVQQGSQVFLGAAQVSNPFDMNCISCREPGPCAAIGCRWCRTVLFLATPPVPAAAPAAARVAWTTAAVAAVAAGAVAAAAMAPVGVVVTAAVAAAAAVAATVTSGEKLYPVFGSYGSESTACLR
jgi:hypothetical protein